MKISICGEIVSQFCWWEDRGSLGKWLRVPLALPLLAAIAVPFARAAQIETLDRVVASIRGVPITQSDVDREHRLERFLATGRVPGTPPDAATRKAVLARLIDQKLLADQLGNYKIDENAVRAASDRRLAQVKKRCGSGAEFQKALGELGMDENQFAGYLGRQEKIEAMIEVRFRPIAIVNSKEISDYYSRTYAPAYVRAQHTAPPPLLEVGNRIRQILVEERINRLLDQWLSVLRRDGGVQIIAPDSSQAGGRSTALQIAR